MLGLSVWALKGRHERTTFDGSDEPQWAVFEGHRLLSRELEIFDILADVSGI